MNRWVRISFDGAMAHAVSPGLVSSLIVDMFSRGHRINNFEAEYGIEQARAFGGNPAAITEWAFDVGGMCHKDTPQEVFDIDGLAISVPVDQYELVHAAIERVDRAPIRRFADGAWYYKLKFWIHATVLTPTQRDTLLHAIEDRRTQAIDRARAFKAAIDRHRRSGVS